MLHLVSHSAMDITPETPMMPRTTHAEAKPFPKLTQLPVSHSAMDTTLETLMTARTTHADLVPLACTKTPAPEKLFPSVTELTLIKIALLHNK